VEAYVGGAQGEIDSTMKKFQETSAYVHSHVMSCLVMSSQKSTRETGAGHGLKTDVPGNTDIWK